MLTSRNREILPRLLLSPAGVAPRLFRGRFTPAPLPAVSPASAAPAAGAQPSTGTDSASPLASALSRTVASGGSRLDSAAASAYESCLSGSTAYATPATTYTSDEGHGQVKRGPPVSAPCVFPYALLSFSSR